MKSNQARMPFYISIGFTLCVIAIEILAVLFLNNGMFVYTLDDPYIHLALSENIWNAHYGINANEFSSPSSSILWPFIIAPLSHYEYFPFAINVIFAVATVFFLVRILQASFDIDNRWTKYIVAVAAISLVLGANIVGLVFTGMEHSFQVLLAVIIAYGLIIEIEKGEVKVWLLFAIIVAPLVRYECLAISVAALIYLVRQRYFNQSLTAIVLLVTLLGGFSFFLMALGLEPFPTSVVAKSSVIESGGKLYPLLSNFRVSLMKDRQGIIMSFGVLALMLSLLFPRDAKRKQLAIITVFAVLTYFIAGHSGWYNRYEIFIWLFLFLVNFFIFGRMIKILAEKQSLGVLGIVILVGFPIVVAGIPYVAGLFTLPIASNNIYEQQYQMHRFAVDYYKKPVAVNDLGYVSYRNNNYVLDLWGLGSEKAFKLRITNRNGDWLRGICEEYSIGLVMIYQEWYKHIPDKWIRVGSLHLGKAKISPAVSEVVFYATSQDALEDISVKLRLFIKTLPPDVRFSFQDDHS